MKLDIMVLLEYCWGENKKKHTKSINSSKLHHDMNHLFEESGLVGVQSVEMGSG